MERQRLVRDLALALGIAAALAFVVRRRLRPEFDLASGVASEIDAAPLVVIRGAFDDVTVSATDGPRVELSAYGPGALDEIVGIRRAADGSRLTLDVAPRRRLDVYVPRGTALRLRVAKSSTAVFGIDNVDVVCAKSTVGLHDVGGRIRVRAAKTAIDVDLARDRETRSVDASIAKSRFDLALPPKRGGRYDVDAAKSRLRLPASVEDGIPIAVRAARAAIDIHAA